VKFKQEKRLDNKLRHWRQVAISACEQSGRLSVPLICEPRSFSDWLEGVDEAPKIILQPGGNKRLAELAVNDALCVLSGPEGGFSEQELALAEQAGFLRTGMGPRVLRTETAPIAALAILQACFGDI
jgi:16S rRNA (uracil1498-N3)-methyltransferase